MGRHVTTGRGRQHAERILQGFGGILQVDGYAGYNRLIAVDRIGPGKVIHCRRPWRSCEAVEYACLEWVDWFSNRRLLELIGNNPSGEAEANFHAAPKTEPMDA